MSSFFLKFDAFSGMIPRSDPELLPDNSAAIAKNLSVDTGKLRSIVVPEIATPPNPIVPSAVHGDEYERYYCIKSGTLYQCSSSNETGHKAFIREPGAITLLKTESTIDTLLEGAKCIWHTGWEPASDDIDKTKLIFDHEITMTGTPVRNDKDGTYTVQFESSDAISESLSNAASGHHNEYYTVILSNGEMIQFGFFSGIQKDLDLTDFKGNIIGKITATFAGTEDTGDRPNGGSGTINIAPFRITATFTPTFTAQVKDAYYLARFVTEDGAEGPPGELSLMISRKPHERLFLAVPDVPAADDESIPISKVRIYRSGGTLSDAGFYFLSEYPNEDAEETVQLPADVEVPDGHILVVDNGEDLSELMPNYGNPSEMDFIVLMSGGFYAAAKKNSRDVYFSDPYLPIQWPGKYALTVGYPITGMAVRNNYLYVMTTGPLYLFVGSAPDEMTPVDTAFQHPIVSVKSMTKSGGDIFYAAADGIIRIGNGGPEIISRKYFTDDQFKAMMPESFVSAASNSKLYVNFDGVLQIGQYDPVSGGTLIFDLETSVLTISEKMGECEYPPYNKDVYLGAQYGENILMESSEKNISEWISKTFRYDRPVAPACVRIDFDFEANPDESAWGLQLLASSGGGALTTVHSFDTSKVKNGVAFRVPVLRRERLWAVRIFNFIGVVRGVTLSDAMLRM